MADRIQHIACQRRVTGRDVTEQADKNKVQHYVGIPLLLVLCHRIVVNTIEQVQRCQNRQDLQPGQINRVGTVLLRAHQTCENRNGNERNALLKKAADRKPERRPCLNRYVYFMIPALT